MSGLLMQNGKQSFSDANGRPLVNGKVFFYVIATNTLKDTWQDSAQTVLNTNPVILDARGEASIYGSGAYRQVLKTADDVLIWDQIIPDSQQNTAANISISDFNGVTRSLQQITSAFGGVMVGYKAPFVGSVLQPLDDKLSQTCHIDDFPDSPAATWLERAIAGTPAGWTLQLGPGPYIGKPGGAYTRDNITIRGVGRPTPDAGRLVMSGGTVIRGTFHINGRNLRVYDLGVDCGNQACLDLNGGAAMDGFVISKTGSPQTNVIVKEVSALCKSPTDLVHAILLENIIGYEYDQLHGYQGFVGVVNKCQNGYMGNCYGYKNSQSGIQIKSNSYAIQGRTDLGFLSADDEGLSLPGTVGVFVYAEDAQLQQIYGGVIKTKGFDAGLGFFCTSTNPINDVNLISVNAENPLSFGVTSDGPILQASIATVEVTGSASGRSIRISADNLGFHFGEIFTSCLIAFNLDDSIQLGGVFTAGKIVATQAYNIGAPTGVSISPSGVNQRSWRIGSYIARLSVNTGAGSNYRGGWGTANGDAARCWVEGGTVRFRGSVTIPAAASRPGAEQFYQANPLISPLTPALRQFNMTVFTSAAVACTTSIGQINPSGVVTAPYLTNTTHFPTAAVYATFDASWPLD